MKFLETKLAGAYLIEWEAMDDERGYFACTRSDEEFSALGLCNDLPECSLSFNQHQGTLRGMHFQLPPHEQVKLVMCVGGLVFDALIDLRPDSETFTHSFSTELSLENHRMLYVPAGIAHGFLTLTDDSYVQYQIGGDYAPDSSRGVRWNDAQFDIEWPMQPVVISERDSNYGDFKP